MRLINFCLLGLVLLVVYLSSAAQATIDFNNLTGGCNDLQGRDCGGHGVCVDGSCVCDPLWSKLTDFVVLEECATSYIGVYILWILDAIAVLLAYYKSSAMILLRFEIFFEMRKTKRNYTIWSNKGLIAILLYFVISAPFHLMMSVAHFVDPTTRVGFDVFASLCFFMTKVGFYGCLFFSQSTMFSHVLKGIRGGEWLVPVNTAFQAFVVMLSILNGGMAFVTLIHFQNDVPQQISVMQAYYAIQAITLFFNSTGALVLTKAVNRVFASVKDMSSRTEDVKKKINDLQMSAFKQAGIQAVVYLLMASIPFFINKHQYFLPMSWLTMPFLCTKLAKQFTTDRGAKTIMQRLGIQKTGSSGFNDANSSSRPLKGVDNNVLNTTSGGGNHGVSITTVAVGPLQSDKFDVVSPLKSSTKRMIRNQAGSSVFSSGGYLDELMDPAHPLHQRFLDFTKAKYATNEVTLFDSLIKYRDADDSKERTRIGKLIMKNHILDDAPQAVDVPYDIRAILLSTAKRTQFVPTTFDDLRRILVFEIKGNFLIKFENLIAKELTEKGAAAS